MKLLFKILKISLISIGIFAILISLLFGYRDIPLEDLKVKYAKAPSAFISVGGMEVHYRDEGNADDSIPIVLIHGTGASLHTFDAWTTQLKQSHRVIRMDLPAYGLTGPFPDRNYSTGNYVNFIHEFLKAIGVERCVLGGNSLGGGIAWNFTVKHPNLVDKLILIDASGYPTSAKSKPIAFQLATIPVIKNLFTFITPKSVAEKSIKNVYADKNKVTQELIDRYFELTLREGNRQAFVDRLGTKYDTTAYKNINSIQQETLILWGDKDKLIPLQNAYRFQKDLPNDTIVILQDVGHVPMEENPAESLKAVTSFLERYSEGKGKI